MDLKLGSYLRVRFLKRATHPTHTQCNHQLDVRVDSMAMFPSLETWMEVSISR
jgi:hypothetical protein